MKQLLVYCPLYASNYAPILIKEDDFDKVKSILKAMKEYLVKNDIRMPDVTSLIESGIKDPNYVVFWYDDLNELIQKYYKLPIYLDSLNKTKVTINYSDLPFEIQNNPYFIEENEEDEEDEEEGVTDVQRNVTSTWAFRYISFSHMDDFQIDFYKRNN